MTGPASRFPSQSSTASAEASGELARFMSRVYAWMFAGLGITGFVAWKVANTPELAQAILGNRIVFYALFIAQIGVVIGLTAAIRKLSVSVATLLYLGYALLTGLTFSTIFLVYQQQSIESAFWTTSAAFAGLSVFGFVTKRDLGPVGSFCMMGLFGMIGFALISMFVPSLMGSTASKVYSIVGIIVFAGLTAYDTQRIKGMYAIGSEGSSESRKSAIVGALALYLDFINLFLSILRLSGNRR